MNRSVRIMPIAFFMACAMCFAAPIQAQTIIFQDDFESGNFEKWDDDSNGGDPTRIKMVSDPALVFRGKHSVEITAKQAKGAGGKLNKWFMPGYDKVHVRFYTKFASDFDQNNHMHYCHLLANRWDDKWSAFGKAGRRPTGADFFSTGLEPWRDWKNNPPPGEWMLYTYHMDMPADPKGKEIWGEDKYWGEMKRPDEKALAERGKWLCMEMMVKANTPGKADGEEAFWVDGVKKGHFKNLRWRDDGRLKINAFWLMLYVHDSPKVNKVWFDDVVIADDYIGPIER